MDSLSHLLAHNAMLHKGSLSAQQLEAINLSVSEATGCDYCLAAHTLMAKKAGFSSCLLYTSPSPRDATLSRMPSSAMDLSLIHI